MRINKDDPRYRQHEAEWAGRGYKVICHYFEGRGPAYTHLWMLVGHEESSFCTIVVHLLDEGGRFEVEGTASIAGKYCPDVTMLDTADRLGWADRHSVDSANVRLWRAKCREIIEESTIK